MAQGDVFHALKHAYRQKILRTLRRRPRTYSTLAKVEPDGEGTGSFNYHLRFLKDAGLVEVDETLYRPTSNGFAALQLLAQAPEGTSAPPRRRVQLTIAGSLIGVGGIGLLLLLSVFFAPVVLDGPGTAQVPGWNIPIFVSELDREAASPQVAVDADGNAIAIWTQDDGAHINVWANRFVTGVGWGAPTLIEKDDTGDAGEPMLAIDPVGNAWAVWHQTVGSNPDWPLNVWANRFVPEAGWGEAAVVAEDTVAEDIALDASGALTIVRIDYGRHGFALYADRFFHDIGWVGTKAIRDYVHRPDDHRNPSVQLAVDAEGRAMAVWWEDGGIYSSRYVPNEEWGPTNPSWASRRRPYRRGGPVACDGLGRQRHRHLVLGSGHIRRGNLCGPFRSRLRLGRGCPDRGKAKLSFLCEDHPISRRCRGERDPCIPCTVASGRQ